jgi:hypothetical protein
MSLNKITSSELKKLISIVKRKERLQEELAEIESKLSATLSAQPRSLRKTRRRGRVNSRSEFITPEPKVREEKTKSAPLSRGLKAGQRSGSLKDLILVALKKAGPRGLSVSELAAALGTNSGSLHVWFSTIGKYTDGLTKLGPGRWKYCS